MRHVAFFRNVNQGQRGHPATLDLVGAFADERIPDAVAFQSNGTVVFSARDGDAVAAAVRERLADRGVFGDVIHVRPLSFIEEVVQVHAGAPDGARRELTLFSRAGALDPTAIERESSRRLCRVVEVGDGWAVVRNDRERQSNGTSTIEAVLGAPATSRGLPSLVRLVARFAA